MQSGKNMEREIKSRIKLNGQTLEVDTYKYLGELIRKKKNMEAHMEATEAKIHAAIQNIITEKDNKELKGLKMQAFWPLFDAIWPLFDATIISIMTYGFEGWNLSKKTKINSKQSTTRQ